MVLVDDLSSTAVDISFTPLDPIPLSTEWCFYFDDGIFHGKTAKQYLSHMVELGRFGSIQTFWQYFDRIEGTLNKICKAGRWTLRLFKACIKPVWEDKHNLNGGKLVISCDSLGMARSTWFELVLATVGEQLPQRHLVCGLVLAQRKGRRQIQLWMSADPFSSDTEFNGLSDKNTSKEDFASQLKDILRLQGSCRISYESHERHQVVKQAARQARSKMDRSQLQKLKQINKRKKKYKAKTWNVEDVEASSRPLTKEQRQWLARVERKQAKARSMPVFGKNTPPLPYNEATHKLIRSLASQAGNQVNQSSTPPTSHRNPAKQLRGQRGRESKLKEEKRGRERVKTPQKARARAGSSVCTLQRSMTEVPWVELAPVMPMRVVSTHGSTILHMLQSARQTQAVQRPQTQSEFKECSFQTTAPATAKAAMRPLLVSSPTTPTTPRLDDSCEVSNGCEPLPISRRHPSRGPSRMSPFRSAASPTFAHSSLRRRRKQQLPVMEWVQTRRRASLTCHTSSHDTTHHPNSQNNTVLQKSRKTLHPRVCTQQGAEDGSSSDGVESRGARRRRRRRARQEQLKATQTDDSHFCGPEPTSLLALSAIPMSSSSFPSPNPRPLKSKLMLLRARSLPLPAPTPAFGRAVSLPLVLGRGLKVSTGNGIPRNSLQALSVFADPCTTQHASLQGQALMQADAQRFKSSQLSRLPLLILVLLMGFGLMCAVDGSKTELTAPETALCSQTNHSSQSRLPSASQHHNPLPLSLEVNPLSPPQRRSASSLPSS